jgi:hypothetical protein
MPTYTQGEMMNMPSSNVEWMFVTFAILAFLLLHGCEVDGVLDDYSPSLPAEKPAEPHGGWPPSEAPFSVRSSSAEVEVTDPPVDLHEPCGTIAEFLASLPGAEMRKSPGQGNDSLSETEQSACHVQAFGRFSALGGDDPAELIRNKFQLMGWKEELRFAADGPDGTSFTFGKGRVLCRFQGSWDGGDDSYPAYEPSDEYRISATCIRSSPDRPTSMQHKKP